MSRLIYYSSVYDLEIIERYGSGIARIDAACKEAGVPPPIIEEQSGGFTIIFTKATTEDGTPEVINGSGKTTQETTQEKIISILKMKPESTRNELSAQIGITPDGIKYHLTKLKAAGIIRHVGPTKSGSWEVIDKS